MRILLTNFTHQNKMTSIIFYFLILIFNLNTLSASNMWDLSLLTTDNTEHKNLVTTLYESLNQLERTKDLNASLTNISSAIGNLENTQFIQYKGNFYKSAISQVKKKQQTLAKLKQDYLDELKEKCNTFLNPEPQKKELQQSEQIESDLRDTWDFSQMKQGSVYDGKREELEQLVAQPLNKGYAETVLNDQFKTIAKLVTELNIKAQGSYSFWNNQQSPNDFNLIKQSLASLAKKLKNQSSGEVLSSSDSDNDNDDEYVSCDDCDTNSDQETENPPVIENNSSVIDNKSLEVQKIVTKTTNPQSNNVNLDNTKNLTASDSNPQDPKNLFEKVSSVSPSINNQSPETFNPVEKKIVEEIVPKSTNNTPIIKTPSGFNKEENQIYEQNPTSIGKNPNSKPNKSTWFKPKIIFGVALFSITVYWFVKNYLFGKNPA